MQSHSAGPFAPSILRITVSRWNRCPVMSIRLFMLLLSFFDLSFLFEHPRRVALAVYVDDEYTVACLCEYFRDGCRARCLPDSALLERKNYTICHLLPSFSSHLVASCGFYTVIIQQFSVFVKGALVRVILSFFRFCHGCDNPISKGSSSSEIISNCGISLAVSVDGV